jgi:hypothetical protein
MVKQINKLLRNEDTIRVGIVALLVALNFGILNYFGDKKFDHINFEPILKVSAGVFVNLALFIFLLYIITLGISKSYKKTKIKELHPFFYDLGLALTAVIVFITLFMALGLKISPFFKDSLIFIYPYLVIGVALGGLIFTKLFGPHMRKIIPSKKIESN